MKELDVQSLPLGPKPRAWLTSVLGNLKRLATDQSIPPQIRKNIETMRELLFEVLEPETKNGEWRIAFYPKEKS